MTDSFGLVENKVLEAEYFLEKLRESKYLSFDASCIFSAFVSAMRSVTFSLQFVMDGVEGFDNWYEIARKTLKSNPLAKYFVEIRNDVVHKGRNPLNQVTYEQLRESLTGQLYFHNRSHVMVIPNVNQEELSTLKDTLPACTVFFTSVLSLVFDCYFTFRMVVDPRWYFTADNFISKGKTLEDAANELGFPSSWVPSSVSDSAAWRVFRDQQPPCILNPLFHKYLGKVIVAPDEEAL